MKPKKELSPQTGESFGREGAREPDGNPGCISGLDSFLLSLGDQLLAWVQPR